MINGRYSGESIQTLAQEEFFSYALCMQAAAN
jgi:hypothetical protein